VRFVAALPQVQDVWVIDRNGRPLLSANVHPIPRTLDLSDPAYFRALRDGDTDILVSEVLRSRAQPSAARPVRVDPSQFQVALINLAANARDAMPAGGTFTVRVEDAVERGSDGDGTEGVRIRVADTGTGMPPEVLDRAIEPFFTTKAPGAGTGLGLPQVRNFAKRSGGHVTVAIEPGGGTVFTLFLPRRDRAGTVPPRRVEAATVAAGVARRILLVEDHDAVAAGLLDAMGHSVERAGDVAQAEAIASRGRAPAASRTARSPRRPRLRPARRPPPAPAAVRRAADGRDATAGPPARGPRER
jgi:hypothetical protein